MFVSMVQALTTDQYPPHWLKTSLDELDLSFPTEDHLSEFDSHHLNLCQNEDILGTRDL